MGKRTIKSWQINWLRLFLVKEVSGALQAPRLGSSDCATLNTGSIPQVEVSIDGERPLIARVGRGSLATTELKHYPDLGQG